MRQRSEVSGLPWVRKRKSLGPMSARAAKVAKLLGDPQVCNAATEPVQPEVLEAGVLKKRVFPKTAQERKIAWKTKQQPKEKKAPMTAKERKDALKMKQQAKEKKAPLTAKERKDAWKMKQQDAQKKVASESDAAAAAS